MIVPSPIQYSPLPLQSPTPPPPPNCPHVCYASTYTCTPLLSATTGCVPGALTLTTGVFANCAVQLPSLLSNPTHGPALTHLYLCASSGCTSDAALLALPAAPPGTESFVTFNLTLSAAAVTSLTPAAVAALTAAVAHSLGVATSAVTLSAASLSATPQSLTFSVATGQPGAVVASLSPARFNVSGSTTFGGVYLGPLALQGPPATSMGLHAPPPANVGGPSQLSPPPAPGPANLAALAVVAVPLLAIAALVWWRQRRRRAAGQWGRRAGGTGGKGAASWGRRPAGAPKWLPSDEGGSHPEPCPPPMPNRGDWMSEAAAPAAQLTRAQLIMMDASNANLDSHQSWY